jgi:hypothetical protein
MGSREHPTRNAMGHPVAQDPLPLGRTGVLAPRRLHHCETRDIAVKLEHLLAIIGGTFLVVALILGLMPVTAGGIRCGTALTGATDDAAVADLTATLVGGPNSGSDHGDLLANEHACTDSLGAPRTITFALGLPALLLLGAAAWARNSQKEQRTPRETG